MFRLILLIALNIFISIHTTKSFLLHSFVVPRPIRLKKTQLNKLHNPTDVCHKKPYFDGYAEMVYRAVSKRLNNPTPAYELDNILIQMKCHYANRKIIQNDQRRIIGRHIIKAHYDSELVPHASRILNSMGSMKFLITDFMSETLDCLLEANEQSITEMSSNVFPTLTGLCGMGYRYSKLKPSLVAVMDKALSVMMSRKFDLLHLRCLGHLDWYWSLLSDTTKTAIQTTLSCMFYGMKADEVYEVLVSLATVHTTYEELDLLRDSLIEAVEEHIDKYDEKYFGSLSQLKIPFTALSEEYQEKIEHTSMVSFRRGDPMVLTNLCLMNATEEHFSEEFISFLYDELPTHLHSSLSHECLLYLKRLSEMKLKWKSFSSENQQIITSILDKHLPTLSEASLQSVVESLKNMKCPVKDYPTLLQSHVKKIKDSDRKKKKRAATKSDASIDTTIVTVLDKYHPMSKFKGHRVDQAFLDRPLLTKHLSVVDVEATFNDLEAEKRERVIEIPARSTNRYIDTTSKRVSDKIR